MNVTRRPDPVQRSQIESRSHTTSFMCWTCGSCDFECPVNIATGRLRPQKLMRLTTLGLLKDLFVSPTIWLCLSCGRCTDACSQMVDGRLVITALQKAALDSGAVGRGFTQRLEETEKFIFPRFLSEVDVLFGFNRPGSADTGAGMIPAASYV